MVDGKSIQKVSNPQPVHTSTSAWYTFLRSCKRTRCEFELNCHEEMLCWRHHMGFNSRVAAVHSTQQALLRSQSGPMSGLPFSDVPSSSSARFPAHLFRVLLLRRLWLPLPLASRTCRCRPPRVFGHHRAACARAGVRAPAMSFASLDVLNLSVLFESRPRLMRSVPHILRGGFRLALRVAFEARAVRGWKLLLVFPRMLLWRPPRGGTVSRKKLEARIGRPEQGQHRAVRQRRWNQDEEVAQAAQAAKLWKARALSLAISPHWEF